MIMAMEMAELEALLRIHPKTLTDLDVAAALQLVRLSGEDYSNNNNNQKRRRRRRKNKNEGHFEDDEEEFDRSSQNEITSKTIEEIFGKEEEVARPRKKRYRSLDDDETSIFAFLKWDHWLAKRALSLMSILLRGWCTSHTPSSYTMDVNSSNNKMQEIYYRTKSNLA
ncbi:hypothetical protein D5086_010322 [Populus alba]|uniref:Uncharacterized protein n=1 Tax=Populus alba TaxID=43335 RepID=A0ACC4C931_POPAL